MSEDKTKQILESLSQGTLSVDEALLQLKKEPFTDLGFAKVDHHRAVRQGAAEVIYGAGKTPDQIAQIAQSLIDNGETCVLITRLNADAAKQVEVMLAEKAKASASFTYHELARLAVVGALPKPTGNGTIVVAAAGTSDLPVAEEAAFTAEALGNEVVRLYDVGVSGIHRLFAHVDELMAAQVIIAVAGMEGALASVIGGMVSCPVIAVPTSVGYGASFHGLAALLSMLNSCASGLSVVNIDNGFGAAFQAHQINHLKVQKRTLYLEIDKDARRAHLLEMLLAHLTPAEKARYDELMARIEVPEKHFDHLSDINELIIDLPVDAELKEMLRGVYAILAQAEATVHGCAVDETHFHEVGNASGIRNTIAIAAAFFVLNPDCVKASPLQTGSGKIECAHGLMDIPAPATKAILDRFDIPLASDLEEGELCTPTSAAIIAYFLNRNTSKLKDAD